MTEQIQKDKSNSQALLFIDRMMDTVDIVVSQVTSGRWLLTVAAGVCLIHFAFTTGNQDKTIDLIKDIVIFYFVVRDNSKQSEKTNGGTNVKTTTSIPNGATVSADVSKG